MIILRVETKEANKGPYQEFINSIDDEAISAGAILSGYNGGNRESHTPHYAFDGISLNDLDLYFGFSNVNQLKNWFKDTLKNIEVASQFNVSIYSSLNFQVGKTQVCFNINESRKLWSICMVKFFELMS